MERIKFYFPSQDFTASSVLQVSLIKQRNAVEEGRSADGEYFIIRRRLLRLTRGFIYLFA